MVDGTGQSKRIEMTEDELEEIVDRTVRKTLFGLGMRVDTPEAVENARKDFQHLRDWRESVDSAKKYGVLTVVGILVTGVCGAILLGTVSFFNHQ